MTANDRWPRPFWRHYSLRYPKTHRANIFLEGWGNYKAWYQVDYLNLAVKQLLRTGGNVVVYVTGEKGENKKHALARLNPYQEQIAKVTSNFLTPQAPKPALCANFFPLKGGTRNPENWNDAVDFMEECLREYEKVFFHESMKRGKHKTFSF